VNFLSRGFHKFTLQTDRHTHRDRCDKTDATVNITTSQWVVKTSGQSKGERGGTAFLHLLFSASVVPPPPMFSLCSFPTWIQMLSVNYMLKSQ